MITLQELQEIVAEGFFNGDGGIAGMVLYSVALCLIFMFTYKRSWLLPFALILPVTLIFTSLEVLPESFTVLMVLVSLIGMATAIKDKVV
jgi:hypothetical protein